MNLPPVIGSHFDPVGLRVGKNPRGVLGGHSGPRSARCLGGIRDETEVQDTGRTTREPVRRIARG